MRSSGWRRGVGGESGDFDEIYTAKGGASTPREPVPKGKVLQALYTMGVDAGRPIVSLVCEPALDGAVFGTASSGKNQQRLLAHVVANLFFSDAVQSGPLASPSASITETYKFSGTIRENERSQIFEPQQGRH